MCVVKYKFKSKTGGFESYDSHQLLCDLCGGMVSWTLNHSVSLDLVSVYISTLVCLEDRKWCGLIGSLQKTNHYYQVAVGSIRVFSKLGCVFIKFTERESALLKHNNKEEKEILPFVTQYQPSSVYFKRSFNEKLESYTKPTVTSPNFQRTTYHFLQERKIPKGHAR